MSTPASARADAGMAERWRQLGAPWRWLIAAVGLLVAFNVVVAAVGAVSGGPAPGGPPSSSYATAGPGAAAYAELLGGHGHRVRRLRARLDRGRLDPGSTVVVLDPDELEDREAHALRRFVTGGGRLVAAGRQVAPALATVLRPAPAWSPAGVRRATPLVPVAEVAGVTGVRAAGTGSWEDSGQGLPVLGDRQRVLAAVASVGAGRVVLLADASVLQNRLLATAGNAAFALAAAGPPSRPVAFAEAAHGYGEVQGLAALPPRWRWALAGAAVATLAWVWSRGKRFGPPEDESRGLPPPRRAYVDAVAATLARSGEPGPAVEPLRRAARAALARRAGLPPDASDADLAAAAVRLGASPGDVAALVGPVTTADDVMAAGRAMAWVASVGR